MLFLKGYFSIFEKNTLERVKCCFPVVLAFACALRYTDYCFHCHRYFDAQPWRPCLRITFVPLTDQPVTFPLNALGRWYLTMTFCEFKKENVFGKIIAYMKAGNFVIKINVMWKYNIPCEIFTVTIRYQYFQGLRKGNRKYQMLFIAKVSTFYI